jgi:queuine/archaeosine tRNA-ribosyltransferase
MSQTKEWMEEATLDLESTNRKVANLVVKTGVDEKLRDLFLKSTDTEIAATDLLLEQLKLNYVAVRAHKEFLIRQRKHAEGDRV